MSRQPAAPSNLRNGLKWRDGRPRWEPSPANRACGFSGLDLRDAEGRWMDRGAATTAADARTLWATFVREGMRDTDAGGKARSQLRQAIDLLPPMPTDPEARRRRELVSDLIERGRAVLEDREPGVTAALLTGPRTVKAMVEAFFNDSAHLANLAPNTQRAYRIQSGKLVARFGAKRVDELSKAQLRQWYLDLKSEISVSTANIALGAASAIFIWASWQEPAWITDNPCARIGRDPTPGRLVFYTPEEERAFIPWCDANGYADVADCAVFGLYTGARQIDVCMLDMPDVEGKQTWRFKPEKTKRKDQEALPGLLPQVQARIARRRAELDTAPVRHLNAEPFLWDGRNNRRHTSASIGYRFTEARDAAIKAEAIPGTFATKHLQDTRDTCVTRLWAAKVSLERIATWGGWAFDSVGNIIRKHYLSLLDDGAIETAAMLEAWASEQGLALDAA